MKLFQSLNLKSLFNYFRAFKDVSVYLEGITDYTGSMSRDEFLNHFYAIENVEERFRQLLKKNPIWVELAEKRSPEFFYECIKHRNSNGKRVSHAELQLCIFDCFTGGCPVIKIEEYVVSG